MNQTKKPDTTEKDNIKSNFSSIPLSQYSPVSYDETLSGYGYVTWGLRNDFPQYLWSVYMNCPTLQSIINGYTDYTCGNEIINNTPFTDENPSGDTLQDVIGKCALDRWVYGGYAFQIFYNQLGEPFYISYIDIMNLRVSRDLKKIYIIDEFKSFNHGTKVKDTLCFAAFGSLTQEERAKIGTEIFYYKGSKSKCHYPVCDWIAALISAEIQIEIKKYHFNNIHNGMLSGTIINFNNNESVSDEVKEEVEAAIKRKFSGSCGAGEILISWNEDKEHEVSISKLDDDNFDSKFSPLAESTREDLFISLRASPQLFGLNLNTAFNEQEFYEVFNLSNKTSILPKQNEIIRSLNKAFGMGKNSASGIDAIQIVPFSLNSNTLQDE